MLAVLMYGGLVPAALASDPNCRIVFEDNFNRSERQESVDEVGEGWTTNSAWRANGEKQVDLQNGHMVVTRHPDADHAVTIARDAAFRDGQIEVRFRLDDPEDQLGVNFADPTLETVQAGHLFFVKVSAKDVKFNDFKTGRMNLAVRKRYLDKTLGPAAMAVIRAAQKRVPHVTSVGDWHDLRIRVDGVTLQAWVDGVDVGIFTSPGIAHPIKRVLRLNIQRNAVIDAVSVRSCSLTE